MRRGACPSLANPMETGDGLLVRLKPVSAGFVPEQWTTLAILARSFGNGLLEITQRGNLQIRGLTRQTAPLLARSLDETGLFARSGVAIETPPLSGLDPTEVADATALADKIRQAVNGYPSASTLAPKLSIVVNGGGRLNLSTTSADLRLDAVETGDQTIWRVAVAGDAFSAKPVISLHEDAAVDAVLALIKKLSAKGPSARGRDIADSVVPVEAHTPSLLPRNAFAEPVDPVGSIDIGAISVLGIRLTYGRMHANDLEGLIADLAELGAKEIRLSPRRALLVLGLPSGTTAEALTRASEWGFLTDPANPANAISACPGMGFCAAAQLDTRRAAEALIVSAPSLMDGSCNIHISGCTKGCAHPASTPLTVVGTDQGPGIVVDGRACDSAATVGNQADLYSTFSRLGRFISRRRRPGETAHALFRRLGTSKLTAILKGKA